MTLREVSLNQERGRCVSARHVNARGSTWRGTILPGSRATAPHLQPDRQPVNAPAGLDAQKNEGFARFMKQHASPTHQRVTASGRIVPMKPNIAPPPQFKELIDNLACGNNSTGQQQMVGEQKIDDNKRPADQHNNTGVAKTDLPKTDLPSIHPEQNQQTMTQNNGTTAKPIVNTGSGGLKNGNRKPRPSDLQIPVAHESSKGLDETFTNSASSFNTYTPPSTGFSFSNMPFNPHSNMLVASGPQNPFMMPALTPSTPFTPFTPVTGADQTHLLATRGENFGLVQQGLQPGFGNNWNTAVPVSSMGNSQLPHPASAPLGGTITSLGAPQNNLMTQIGAYFQPGPHGPGPMTNMSVNNMTMNNSFAQSGNGAAHKVTEKDVAKAERAFHDVDLNLKGHDMYTASHYTSFTQAVKSHYAKERMKLVEQRDLARRKWNQLRAELEGDRSIERNQPAPANQQQTFSTKVMTTGPVQKNANTNLNVQAAAWVPGDAKKGSGVHIHPQPASSNVTNQSIVGNPTADVVKFGTAHPSFAGSMNQPFGAQLTNQHTMQPFAQPSAGIQGPYTRQFMQPTHTILGQVHDWEVDEWGGRNAFAPPAVAQMQHEWGLRLEAQLRDNMSRVMSAAPTEPEMCDEWGVQLRYAPKEVADKQDKQNAKLEQMNPEQRRQITLADLDNMPTPKTTPSKIVSFNENTAMIPYTGREDSCDDKSSVKSLNETDTATQSGEGEGSRVLKAIEAATQKAMGARTKIVMADGTTITIEAGPKGGEPVSYDDGAEELEKDHRNQSAMSEQNRTDMAKQLVSIEDGAHGLEGTEKKSGVAGYNLWAFEDHNNPIRYKGVSSVALQSITAIGMPPGFNGVGDREPPTDLKPLPAPGFKVNDSPAKSGSPTKRSLKDIWATPSPRSRAAETEKKDASGKPKAMPKF